MYAKIEARLFKKEDSHKLKEDSQNQKKEDSTEVIIIIIISIKYGF